MEWQRAEGIILRRHPVTETSLLVTWFTRERGLLKTMAKGGRRIKGPFVGRLDLFYQDEMVYLPSRRSDLHLLHECQVVKPRLALRGSLDRLVLAAYAVELVELISEREDPHPSSFRALEFTLDALGESRQPRVLLIWLALQLLAEAGWRPDWEGKGAIRRVLNALLQSPQEAISRVVLNEAQEQEGLGVVTGFWQRHVGRNPRSGRLIEQQFRR